MNSKFHVKNKASNYNKSSNTTHQPQPNHMVNQVQHRTNTSILTKLNYNNVKRFTPHPSKDDLLEKKDNANTMQGNSKLTPRKFQPSMDKVGNPICFKCGKIGYARDCPKHPYKPRVYALGISEEIETLEDLPEETDEVPEEDEEPGKVNQNIIWEDEEDKYVEDPYNGEFAQEGLHMGDDLPDGDYPAQMNMMSFINESDDYSHVHLASAKQTEGIPTEETFINRLIEKPIEYVKNLKSQYLTKSSILDQIMNETAPQKILKRTPPIMDSKLRISCQAGTYPANRSANLR